MHGDRWLKILRRMGAAGAPRDLYSARLCVEGPLPLREGLVHLIYITRTGSARTAGGFDDSGYCLRNRRHCFPFSEFEMDNCFSRRVD